ncbi:MULTISPECIES: 50S ribosomal protein L21 [Candidatus Ichthyocystis]|uniref:Large ribosomal subunit protein bL21 n=1 Tax=Candidatus Ichthyocystis hellenicum TaxID=1561003 RepID=A0A0S4M858_9BURK|nr:MULTISPECIES: 50S ribosomal protein L21 [Ichthyocystis]CUT17572.1 50S ribosomal protein L21 [Candidatus Ichthyocystis hellenicum]
MYAVLKTGGKQYRVSVGDVLRVEQLDAEVGSEVGFDEVLLVKRSEKEIDVGRPFLENVLIKGTVVSAGRAGKLRIFKMRRRKHYQKRQGHRQNYTEVRIDSIG